MAAWLLTRIFSFFYYRGQQRKLEKELSELWDAYQAELSWLNSCAPDVVSSTSDVLVAAVAFKRLEERGYDTWLLRPILDEVDATFAAKVWYTTTLCDELVQPLLLAVKERESNTARKSRS
jgi:hypothetical protein